MTETLTKTEKEQAFDQWLDALRSGDYRQGTGFLCTLLNEEYQKQYCCIGVLNEVVVGTEWIPARGNGKILADDVGNVHNLNTYAPIVHTLGLDNVLGAEDADILQEYLPTAEATMTRLGALAGMNDNGTDFDTIAMIIEDTLDWRNR